MLVGIAVLLAGLAGDAAVADAGPGAVRVLTWNVLEPSPAERLLGLLFVTASNERAQRLLREANELDADILAFQEVSAGFMAVLAEDPGWAGYRVSAEGPEAPPTSRPTHWPGSTPSPPRGAGGSTAS